MLQRYLRCIQTPKNPEFVQSLYQNQNGVSSDGEPSDVGNKKLTRITWNQALPGSLELSIYTAFTERKSLMGTRPFSIRPGI